MKATRAPLLILGLSASLLVASACGGEAPPPATPAVAAPPAPPAPPPAAVSTPPVVVPAAWSNDMTKDQQVAYMKQNVVGPMSKVFQAKDATKYASFSCKTCHGPENKDPKEFLPHLKLQGGKMTAFAEAPETAKFMATLVTPEMAKDMGQKPFDPQTHQGFGCNGCHTIDMK